MKTLSKLCIFVVLTITAMFASTNPVIDSVTINYTTNQLTATGTNFSTSATVVFNTTSLTINSITTTQFVVTLPTGLLAGSYLLIITNNPGQTGQISVEYATPTPTLTFQQFCSIAPSSTSYPHANTFSLSATGCTKIIFASSQVYNGNLGGSNGADQKCQQLAITAGLPGQYKSFTNDGRRAPAYSSSPNVPFVRVDSNIFESGLNTPPIVAIDSSFALPLNYPVDETEQSLPTNAGPSVYVWTGLDSSAIPTGNDCQGWTSSSSSNIGTVGWTLTTDGTWANYRTFTCDTQQRLYCLQQ